MKCFAVTETKGKEDGGRSRSAGISGYRICASIPGIVYVHQSRVYVL